MDIDKIFELQRASGAKNKQYVLEKYKNDGDFTRFLYYALNPQVTFNVSEKSLSGDLDFPKRPVKIRWEAVPTIFDLCAFLNSIKGVDRDTLSDVRSYLYSLPKEERNLYTKLLSKTLRLGVTAKTVNKVIPNLIPEWEVQQAYPIDKYPLNKDTTFWVTQKLNGVRATMYNDVIYGRSGAPISGLEHIIKEASFICSQGFVLDGELTLRDKGSLSDNEAFRQATGLINADCDSKNKMNICYTVFDIIPIDDFNSKSPKITYKERRKIMESFDRDIKEKNVKFFSILPVLYSGKDQSVIPTLLNKMVEEDKEGLMINTDVPYKRTRHRGILKVKRFYTMDLPIIRCEEGTGRLKDTLGAFVLDFKGNEVKVGSGFADEERTYFWKNKDKISDALCEVKYKEVSYDKRTNMESLQFPTFVRIRTDKNSVSYG